MLFFSRTGGYCHEHDTHGNADSEEEAQLCAEAHREFWMDQDEDDEPCDVTYKSRAHGRDLLISAPRDP
jgi:hypothetical protein